MADVKINLLLLGLMGLAMFIIAVVLYAVADRLVYGRMLLTLPPISVAAYIYMVNWSAAHDAAALSGPALYTTIGEVFIQTLIGGIAFIIITFLILSGLIAWSSVTSGSS